MKILRVLGELIFFTVGSLVAIALVLLLWLAFRAFVGM